MLTRIKQINTTGVLIRSMAVLFCLAMISMYFCSSIYAKFLTKSNSGALANAAKFLVSAEASAGNPDELQIIPYEAGADGTIKYKVVLKNSGDMASHYEVNMYVNDWLVVDAQGVPLAASGTIKSGETLEVELPVFPEDPGVLDYDNTTGMAQVALRAVATFTQVD